jgi:trigger factor
VKTTLSERDGNTAKLAVEVSTEEVQEAFNTHLKKLSREVHMPGFRPGKAPLTMVRQRLGDEAILIEAVEESMGVWFAEAAMELGLDPVDRPKIDLDNELPEMDKPLGFTATVTVMPEIVLGEYKGIKAPKDAVEVADAEVDSQMDRLRNEFAELRPVSGRAVQKGDFVTADLRASLAGKPLEDFEASDFVFEVGGERVFAQVEEQAIGMSAGEERTFPLELPEGMPDDLAGKTVDFTIALKEIKEKELPALTDQWTSEVSEFATLLELRQEIRSKIREGREHAAEQRFRTAAIEVATGNATIDLPDVVVLGQAEDMLADFKRSIESQGGSLEGYVEATGMTIEQIIEDMKPQAANNVKTTLMLDAIVKAEGLEASDEEISVVIGQMAAAGKMDSKTLEKALYRNNRIQSLTQQILRDKAVDFIAENAVKVAPEPVTEEAATKPAPKAAKKASAEAPVVADAEVAEADGAAEAPAAPEPAEATEVAEATGDTAAEGS